MNMFFFNKILLYFDKLQLHYSVLFLDFFFNWYASYILHCNKASFSIKYFTSYKKFK